MAKKENNYYFDSFAKGISFANDAAALLQECFENYDAAKTHTVYERATAICLMHKARVRANNYYWNKLYRKLELEGKQEEFDELKKKSNDIIC